MEIRPAIQSDIPSIVSLLRLSLGESMMPKTEEFWRWKHVHNPFGKSLVILALEKDQVIGVRAFMRWEWRYNQRIYKAVRAVDTATHPQHQGKGIFKKLTLQLVEQCKADGIHFIFNTPNNSSKPGYLKMGWKSNGKMKLYMRPVLRFGTRQQNFDSLYEIRDASYLNGGIVHDRQLLTTSITNEFFQWRYDQNPNIKYYCFSDRQVDPRYRLYFRLKPFKFGTEFRVCDFFQASSADTSDFRKHLLDVVHASGACIISSAQPLGLPLTFSMAIGPEITTRLLSVDDSVINLNNWKPTLGDMEVF